MNSPAHKSLLCGNLAYGGVPRSAMAIGVSRRELKIALRAGVAEMADAPDLGSGG